MNTPYWQNGKRFATDQNNQPVPDYVQADPVLLERWMQTHPSGDVQVADQDKMGNELWLALAAQLAMGLGQEGGPLGPGVGPGPGGVDSAASDITGGGNISSAITTGQAAGMPSAAGGAAAGSGWMSRAGDIGKAITAMNSGAASGRVAEGEANRQQSDALLRRYEAGVKTNQQATDTRQLDYKNAIRGGLLQGLKDFTITPPADVAAHMGTVSGGMRPSSITGAAPLGEDMQRTALLDLMSGKAAGAGLEGLSKLTMPPPPDQPQQGTGSKIADWLGPALTIGSSFLGARR